MKLMIIEGAGKKDTIKKYLGSDYEVFASKGHVRDLPAKSLAVDIKNNFEPRYENLPEKKDIVKELLAKAKKAEEIVLATDPDREGEAISWHLAHILGLKEDQKCRVVFNEISKNAIWEALAKPRTINKDLVDAQQARRVLDRLVGYKLSPFVSRHIRSNLSAGRVQSVALKLIVDREREIQNFKPEEYWTLNATMQKKNPNPNEIGDNIEFVAQYVGMDGKKVKITNKEQMQEVLGHLKSAEYVVSGIKKGETFSKPHAPYITSTMQQDALNKISFSLAKTTKIAQQLYEGVDIVGFGKTALVTYIRTDSTRVSEQAQASAKKFILENYGAEYCPKTPNVYKSKKSAQDAHEAIRPIDINKTPKSLEGKIPDDCYKLYKLIYDRFLASQMAQAKFYSVSAEINTQNTSKQYNFKATGKTLIFPGFMKVYKAYSEDEETEQDKIPNLNEQDLLNVLKLKEEQKFTKPPARYTEASIVKTMEEKGIGRPATYTPTITLLASRNYTAKDGKFIVPTEIAFTVTDLLVKHFKDIMDVTFTANMETRLDDIEDGGIEWQDVVGKFWRYFEKQLLVAGENAENLRADPIETSLICEKCGKPMVIRDGRFGQFVACSNYPTCKNILKGYKVVDNEPVKIEENEPEISDVICDKCGANMVIKMGKYGKFLACPNYPTCKNIKNLDTSQELGTCPKCGKPLVQKYTKSRKPFIGCSGYPNCDYATNTKNKVDVPKFDEPIPPPEEY